MCRQAPVCSDGGGQQVRAGYTRPLHAHAHAPLHGFRVRASLEMAAKWFIQYLTVLPTLARRAIGERRVVRIWTDAASSPSWLAEVVECVGRFYRQRQHEFSTLIVHGRIAGGSIQTDFREITRYNIGVRNVSHKTPTTSYATPGTLATAHLLQCP